MTSFGLPFQITIDRTTVTLIVGVVGFFGGLLSSFGLYYYRQRKKRSMVRTVLLEELRLPSDQIERALDQDPATATGPIHTEFPTSMYDSLNAEIGLLSTKELKPIIAYYAIANVAQSQLPEIDDDDDIREQFFTLTLPILNRKRERAIRAIEAKQ